MERDMNNTGRLRELGGSDFEIVPGQPNIKGWTVKDAQGRTIGEVEELIFDEQSRKVRYMVVDLEGNVLDLEPRDVLVPIGMAELHESDDDVILPQVSADHLRGLPVYEKDRLDRTVESTILSVFGGAGAVAGATADAVSGDTAGSDEFYNREHYNDQNLYRNRETGSTTIPIIEENLEIGKREVETGGAVINSRIVEKDVEENIRLREEHVNIERTPVNRPATEADLNAFKEGEIELTERAEVPVVKKDTRVGEEVTLSKDVEERDETVRDTIRKTEVDVERIDPQTGLPRTDTGTDPNRNPNV